MMAGGGGVMVVDGPGGGGDRRGSGDPLFNMLENAQQQQQQQQKQAKQSGGRSDKTGGPGVVTEEIVMEGPGGQVMTLEGPQAAQMMAGGPEAMMDMMMGAGPQSGGPQRLSGNLLRGLFPQAMLQPAGAAADVSYKQMPEACVQGHNMGKYPGKTVDECKSICNSDPKCKAFEFGVPHHGDNQKYRPNDCIPNDASDPFGCQGSHFNLDLYVKEAAPNSDQNNRPADPVLADIVQAMDRGFAANMLPAIQKSSDPTACQPEIARLCANAKSHLHCLGLNSESISEACRKEVGKSVPFLCSRFTDRFCDVLQTGILDCLYGHLAELDDQCQDAVKTTKKVINKVNTQKASLLNKSTGDKKSQYARHEGSEADGEGSQSRCKVGPHSRSRETMVAGGWAYHTCNLETSCRGY
jgi:hypothetical protein